MAGLLVLIPTLVGCGELTEGATRQVFVDAAVSLDRVPEGPARDRVLAMTDGGWLHAESVGVARASAFARELERAVVDDALSESEVARLAELADGFGAERAAKHEGELLEKREAEENARRLAVVAPAFDLDTTGLLPAPLAERGASLGWTLQSCHRQQETGYTTETCQFADGDEFVFATVTEFVAPGDARLAEHPGVWERGSVALREGARVLKVRSTSRAAAEAAVDAVLGGVEGVQEGPVALSVLRAGLTELGWRVGPCREDRDDATERRHCEVHDDQSGGSVRVHWVEGSPTVQVRLFTEEASTGRLAQLRT